jgi:hypothetical protein
LVGNKWKEGKHHGKPQGTALIRTLVSSSIHTEVPNSHKCSGGRKTKATENTTDTHQQYQTPRWHGEGEPLLLHVCHSHGGLPCPQRLSESHFQVNPVLSSRPFCASLEKRDRRKMKNPSHTTPHTQGQE